MPSSLLLGAATVGLLLQAATAYTQVNINSAFMRKNIDPIVFPGQHSKSHLHSFFGSDGVTVNTSTSAELQAGCTNAQNINDLSTYWVPTPLFTKDGGKTWEPTGMSRFTAYYNLGEPGAEVAMPQNLKMVAGKATATAPGGMEALAKSEWFCEGDDVPLDKNGFPSSTCSTHLQQLLYFPQCVNTETLETAYANKKCPEGFSRMPQLRFSIRWDLRKNLPNGWSGEAPIKLACGPAWCSHGDFINGWTEEAATDMLKSAAEKRKYISVIGDGQTASCTPADADPENGTSDYAESVAAMSKRSVDSWGWMSRSRFI